MKALRKTYGLVFIALFFMVGVSHGKDAKRNNYNKGVDYGVQGKFKEAKNEFEKALKFDPFYIPAIEGLKAIKEAINLKITEKATIYFFNGAFYSEKGQYNQAISNYNKALEINPNIPIIYSNRGIAYKHKGKYDSAIFDFIQAIKLNPKDAMAYDNWGYTLLVHLGNKSEGCLKWKKACKLGRCKNYEFAKKEGDCK